MFTSTLLRPSVMSLAVFAAFAAPARADDATTIIPSQTFPPTAGAVDTERNNSATILNRIRADDAHGRGINGNGVTIATMDTGLGIAHHEFAEAGKLARGFNAVSGGSDVSDRSGHGTHVAGILGAGRDGRGMFGVAYNATLLPIKVFPDRGSGSTSALDLGLRYAIGKASIVNMSIGASGRYDPRAMQEAVHAGLLMVASAGNSGAANPSWPARFAKEPWANNQIIAVGAVDGANRIASFSNRAGDAAAWYLVAPGVGIASSYLDNRYATMNGTSMAAPMVSGAAALVMQLWPSLRADQVATILFVTATDLGAPGIDTVYGRGLLNIEKALQPIGALTTTTYNGKTIHVLTGSMQPSAATSKLWNLAASGQLRVIGLDDFERDFGVDLGAAVARPAAMSLEQVLGSMDSRMDVVDRVLADNLNLSVAYARTLPSYGLRLKPGMVQDNRLAAFSLMAKGAGGMETAFGIGGMAGSYFGAGGMLGAQGLSLAQETTLSHPYFSLVPGASHAAIGQQVGDVKVKFGVLTSGFNRTLASQEGYLPSSVTQPQANSGLVELSKSFGDAAVAVSVSQTRESNAYLGSYSSGALSLGGRASTSAVQFSGAMLLGPKLALAGQAAYGITPGGGGDSLITEVSRTKTNAFSLALVASDRMRRGDRLSVSVSQPMRAYAGRMVMDMLTGRSSSSSSAAAARERLVFSMVPIGREMRAQLNYFVPLPQQASFGLTLMVRRDPNNMVEASTEKLIAIRYVKQF